MPALSSISFDRNATTTVLITGASGYVGAWILKVALERGYKALAPVRSQAKAVALLRVFAAYKDRLSVVVIPQMTNDGAFDEVVKGVQAIIHTASPTVIENNVTPENGYIWPAVKLAINLLRSVHQYGKGVQRFIMTSSCAALGSSSSSARRPLNHTDWNDEAVIETKTFGNAASAFTQYAASKTLAERAAFAFVREYKPRFDLVTILPSDTFGPSIHEISSMHHKTSSLATFASLFPLSSWGNARPDNSERERLHSEFESLAEFIYVEDVARLHVLALTEQRASGMRLIASSEPWSITRIYDIIHTIQPPLRTSIKGSSSTIDMDSRKELYSSAKLQEIFPDFAFQGLEGAVKALARQFDERVWLT